MSSMDALIRETLNRTANTTLDAVLDIVASLKPEYMARSNDVEAAQDDVVNEVLRRIHIFKMKMNEGE